MALHFIGQGSRDGVLKSVAAFSVDEKSPSADFDKSQLPAFKQLLTAEINALPKDVNGVNVTAQATAHEGLRNFAINIIPLKLHL